MGETAGKIAKVGIHRVPATKRRSREVREMESARVEYDAPRKWPRLPRRAPTTQRTLATAEARVSKAHESKRMEWMCNMTVRLPPND